MEGRRTCSAQAGSDGLAQGRNKKTTFSPLTPPPFSPHTRDCNPRTRDQESTLLLPYPPSTHDRNPRIGDQKFTLLLPYPFKHYTDHTFHKDIIYCKCWKYRTIAPHHK